MDFEKVKRRQSFRVIISEIVMFITVVITVVILAFVVSGYWINEKFEVERQGMLQISSFPSGASITIDNNSPWTQKTNASKVLPVGQHTITLTKPGYDSWSKTINISEGLLYRIHYPRLFPLERQTEIVSDLSSLDTIFKSAETSDPPAVNRAKLLENFKVSLPSSNAAELVQIEFYEDRYLAIVEGNTIIVYKKDEPKPVFSSSLEFVPTTIHPGHNGEFIVLSSGTSLATLDMETLSLSPWTIESEDFGWLDDDMLYTITDGTLIVYDFDGLNRRLLASDVTPRMPVTIVDDKWLYYYSDNVLVRESLVAS